MGLCIKAGKLIYGFDAVSAEIKAGTSNNVLLANDLSDKTIKEIMFLSEKYEIQTVMLPVSMEEIRNVINKRTGILTVTDDKLFKAIIKNM